MCLVAFIGWLDGFQGFETRLAQSRVENIGLLTAVMSEGGVEGNAGRGPVFALRTLAFTLKLRKNHGKASVRV
jgi:hypothetical protein